MGRYNFHISEQTILVALQAFIDDSYQANGVFVLAGFIAAAESWANFSREWEQMLRHGTLGRNGRYHFKMSEMAANPERMARVSWFYRVIERHTIGSVSCKINISDLRKIQAQIFVPGLNIDWGLFANPYCMAFRCLMDTFHNNRARLADWIPLEERIDFFFDEQTEKKPIKEAWNSYVAERPAEVRGFFVSEPRFENDQNFLALQAADLWAWWVRKWYLEGTPEKIEQRDFGAFKGEQKPGTFGLDISFNEDQLRAALKHIVRDNVGPNRPIYNVRLFPEG